MMYSNMEDYERKINELNILISELQNKVYQLQTLVNEKENQVNLLYNENQQLKIKLQDMQLQVEQFPYYKHDATQPPVGQSPSYGQVIAQPPMINQPVNSVSSTGSETYLNKRECPKCGASGFAIKEVEDKSRLISYIPRRIYAKKRVCTKCFYEW